MTYDRHAVIQADSLIYLATLPEASIDAIVTDPPYGLEFMGKEWDKLDWRDGGGFTKPGIGDRPGETANPTCATCGGRARGAKRCTCVQPEWRVRGEVMADRSAERANLQQAWHLAWAKEALRVLKPGGHLLAFGGTRTYHRLACAVEDAGFEIRDQIAWVYGSGFPKSLSVGKAIDKAAGAEREVVGYDETRARPNRLYEAGAIGNIGGSGKASDRTDNGATITAPATPEAERWEGWGTALKPAQEPIVVARKPLVGTVAANVLTHGTGALNIDGCRVPTTENLNGGAYSGGKRNPLLGDTRTPTAAGCYGEDGRLSPEQFEQPEGRWPANLIHDGSPEVLEGFPHGKSGKMPEKVKGWGTRGIYGASSGEVAPTFYADSGSAARFFYCAKVSQAERAGAKHPTVKPIALIRYLQRLVTPPGGIVLDPFLGSGTSLIAADIEGFQLIGVEREAAYHEDIKGRWAAYKDDPEAFR